ncbi:MULTISPECIES: hypothetical protein [Calothrix]|uniref:Uncharacterized protein n=2 Tax=Calothrix TaxID=1186 RepID=A0ABR8A3P5_9CYAN|nr:MULTISPECIES: hypothetical protein [Calothrix]MBD2194582.1 hypothetical protein [Calothrix parietina FACHB-288]MBD2223312.1 hypothetical protein [Calothrix anomala FACHB-343]
MPNAPCPMPHAQCPMPLTKHIVNDIIPQTCNSTLVTCQLLLTIDY